MKNKRIIAILSGVAGLLAMGLLVYVIYSWYVESTLNTDSNNFYAVREGYEEHFESYDTIYNQTLPSYSNSSVTDSYTMVPGDVVYFSYILDVRAEEVSSSSTIYKVEHTGSVSKGSNATSSNGDYASFLGNCCIEANSIRVAIMDKEDDGINYTYSSEVTVTNTADISLYSDGIDISYTITIPRTTTEVMYEDSDSVDHICFMVYVPIWYQDTEVNQNAEMSSTLSITKTIISL